MDSMVNQREILAVIPARGGSKGIPRKNIREFAGYPLIAYSIAAGLQAEQVTRILVSTDDEEIAQVAHDFGAEVPFLRPSELAQDGTPDLPVFEHVLDWLEDNEGYQPDFVVQLRPTSPIRPRGLLDRAIQILIDNPQKDSVRGVVPAGQNPYKMWQIDAQGELIPLLSLAHIKEPYNAPRQALPPVYWQTGHIDVIRLEVILEKRSMTGDRIMPVRIDPAYAVDIDTPKDWERYEWLVQDQDLDMVHPGCQPRTWPEKVSLVVFDFDGVMTDNRVWVNAEGEEFVAAHRGDGMGIEQLLAAGIKAVIISTEPNPAVAARAKKIGLPYFHGVGDKAKVLTGYLDKVGINPMETIFVGNDINDLPCFSIVACAIAVADAHASVRRKADKILKHKGGRGAVREICDILIRNQHSY